MLREVAKYHEVDLIAFNQNDLISPLFPSVDQGVNEARKELGSFCNKLEFLQIPQDQSKIGKYTLAFRSIFTSDPYTVNWLKSDEYAKVLQEFIEEGSYDLIHFDTISLIPYFKYAEGVSTVLDHHNIESHMLLRRADNESNTLKKWYYRQEGKRLERQEKNICPRFSLNITCSKVDADRLEVIAPGSKVEEVPNGVDVNYFKPDTNIQQELSLIFVGTLSWYPNIEAVHFIADEIWPLLKNELPDVSIDIIGANPPEDIVKLSRKDPSFRVHGFVEDVRPFMDRALVYICPINDGGGTKLKILDALSMRKAIVAHPIACEGINVTDGRNVLFAEDSAQYISAIKRLIEDADFRNRIGDEARTLAEDEYSYMKIGKKLSELFVGCAEK